MLLILLLLACVLLLFRRLILGWAWSPLMYQQSSLSNQVEVVWKLPIDEALSDDALRLLNDVEI